MATPNHAADEADMGLTLQQKESALENSLSDEPGDAHTPKYPLTNLDAGLVGWDGQDDPQNPRNFSERKKTSLVLLVSSITVVSPLASSMFAPALGSLAIDFHVTEELLLSFTVSVFVLGYVVGPLLLSFLSEIYGRHIVLSCANWFFAVWQIGCALAPNIGLLIFFRFMSGIGGSWCLTLGGGLIADLYTAEKRGAATALWSLGPLIGPANILGFGMMGVFLPIQLYIIDSYDHCAASAIAALTVTRSLVGALLPLAGPSMYAALGLSWGNTLLGLLCVLFIPIPIALYRYGKVIHKGFPVDL